jgi:hypothetical protein
MNFPEKRLSFTKSVDGKYSEKGFLVLDLHGLDIEGANTLVITMENVERTVRQGDQQEEAKRKARELLGG